MPAATAIRKVKLWMRNKSFLPEDVRIIDNWVRFPNCYLQAYYDIAMAAHGPKVPREKPLTFDEFQTAVNKTYGLVLDSKEVTSTRQSFGLFHVTDKASFWAFRGPEDRSNKFPEMERNFYARS